MPQSFAALYVRAVYSTRHRLPVLVPAPRPDLLAYCGGVLRQRKCALLAASAVLDHVHLLISMHRQTDVASVIRDVKADSSRWPHATCASSPGRSGTGRSVWATPSSGR